MATTETTVVLHEVTWNLAPIPTGRDMAISIDDQGAISGDQVIGAEVTISPDTPAIAGGGIVSVRQEVGRIPVWEVGKVTDCVAYGNGF